LPNLILFNDMGVSLDILKQLVALGLMASKSIKIYTEKFCALNKNPYMSPI
jgi:hypothetical protein